MEKIEKVDYFVGVFVSTILKSAKGVPALFDETDNSKRIQFSTDLGDFNVYIKYSMSLVNKDKRINSEVKNKMSCNVSFTDNDFNILNSNFKKDKYKNYVVLVCTNDKLTETKIAVLPYDDAMKCLQYKVKSGGRRITITRTGGEYSYKCYGVNGPDFPKGHYITSYVNHMKYFDKTAENEE